jgi:DNA-binding cell septation regulator SpoVG
MNNHSIEVTEIHLLNDGRPLKAFASIQIGDWIIHEWRIIQQPRQRAFVSVPQTSWRDREGKIRYRALLSIPGELKQRIEVAILSAWEKELEKNGTSGSER